MRSVNRFSFKKSKARPSAQALRGTQLELTLAPNDEVVVVSDGYAGQIKGWVLGKIEIERRRRL